VHRRARGDRRRPAARVRDFRRSRRTAALAVRHFVTFLAGNPPLASARSLAAFPDLGGLSIEELSQIEITSVSKRPEPLSEAPAAIYVISGDDIRRSGATSLPEALRLAPNLEVARVSAHDYTISGRGTCTARTRKRASRRSTRSGAASTPVRAGATEIVRRRCVRGEAA
jgi:outer membrane receptor protein involved in Fe transport